MGVTNWVGIAQLVERRTGDWKVRGSTREESLHDFYPGGKLAYAGFTPPWPETHPLTRKNYSHENFTPLWNMRLILAWLGTKHNRVSCLTCFLPLPLKFGTRKTCSHCPRNKPVVITDDVLYIQLKQTSKKWLSRKSYIKSADEAKTKSTISSAYFDLFYLLNKLCFEIASFFQSEWSLWYLFV